MFFSTYQTAGFIDLEYFQMLLLFCIQIVFYLHKEETGKPSLIWVYPDMPRQTQFCIKSSKELLYCLVSLLVFKIGQSERLEYCKLKKAFIDVVTFITLHDSFNSHIFRSALWIMLISEAWINIRK